MSIGPITSAYLAPLIDAQLVRLETPRYEARRGVLSTLAASARISSKMPELTASLLDAVDEQLRNVILEAIDYVNQFPPPRRRRVQVVERAGGNYQLGEEDVLDPDLLRTEALLESESFETAALTAAVAAAAGENAGNGEAMRDWTLNAVVRPMLAEYFSVAQFPVVFEEGHYQAARTRVLAVVMAPHAYVHVHPITKVDATERIEVAPGVVIRPVEDAELEEWLNPGPFDALVPQQTVMDIGSVIEIDYDGDNGGGPALETAERLTTVLQLLLDCDGVAPFNEERHRLTRALRAAGYPGSADWRPGLHKQIHPTDAARLAQAMQHIVDRSAVPGLQLALRRWRESARRGRDDDKLIDYWIGLEALFMPDTSSKIKATVSRRVSNYTGVGATREKIAKELRESYKRRSELVHGEHIQGWNVHAVAYQTRGHLRTSLLRVLEDADAFHAPAWDVAPQ